MIDRLPAVLMALGAALLGAGCVAALKEPRPIADLAGADSAGAPGPDEIAGLLDRAETLLDGRDVTGARQAAGLFLRAASAEGAPVEALIGAVRADVWLVDHLTDARARAETATAAVEAAQWCSRRAPGDPACDYWLGAALGMQARERPSTGMSALPQIEQAFLRAARGDPTLDEAGPERALALLYLRAPGWPAGPGDPERGLQHARRAVELRPDHPPNLLALGEALHAAGDLPGARDACTRALERARRLAQDGDRDAPEWTSEAEEALRRPAP